MVMVPHEQWDHEEERWSDREKLDKMEHILTVLRLRRYISRIEYVALPPKQPQHSKQAHPQQQHAHSVKEMVGGVGVQSVLNELKSDGDDDGASGAQSVWEMSK